MADLSQKLVNLGYTGVTGTTPYQPSTTRQVNTLQGWYANALKGSTLTTANSNTVQINVNFDGKTNRCIGN